jgi:hypothetical protein
MKITIYGLCLLGFMAFLSGCGGGGSGSGPSPAPSPQPGQAVITNLGISDPPANIKEKQEI